MVKEQFNKRNPLWFKHFNRKGYSLFAALGKEVLISVLSVSTLTYAKAAGVSDAQLYKQAGNSVTVNIVYEIGVRLKKMEGCIHEI